MHKKSKDDILQKNSGNKSARFLTIFKEIGLQGAHFTMLWNTRKMCFVVFRFRNIKKCNSEMQKKLHSIFTLEGISNTYAPKSLGNCGIFEKPF